MKTLIIDWQGEKTKVMAECLDNGLWFHVNGKTYHYQELQPSGSKRTRKKAANPEQILAPMPGKILKVNCKVGDQTQPGQSLIVLEAMKMEYNLKAEIAGEVVAVNCKEAQQVQLNEQLVELKGTSK